MKKILLGIFLFVTCLGLLGCNCDLSVYIRPEILYDDWYNTTILPNIEKPFDVGYDGMYTIKIDRNNEVKFKTIDGEELTGTLEYEMNKYNTYISVKITFDNNSTASGGISADNNVHKFNFNYAGNRYSFTNKKAISKEEFEIYRNKFNAFLRGAFVHNYFPTIEEVENNDLYKKYTNFYQVDPGCGGPLVYTSAKKAIVYVNPDVYEIDIKYDQEPGYNLRIYDIGCKALVKMDGTFEKIDEIRNGECLITEEGTIYYFETESDNIKMNVTSIEEAYENNKITNKQLQKIANIFDGSNNPIQEIDDKYLLIIKQQYLNELKKTYSDATLSDVIVNVYWSNKTNYVLTIKDSFDDYPAVEKEILIDGITIVYSGSKPIFIEVSNEYE